MNEARFDSLARTLSTTPTRRAILTALTKATAGATLAAIVAVLGNEEAAAGTCRALFVECTSSRQCCGHKKKKRVCAVNQHAGAPAVPSCCIANGKRCTADSECCGSEACSGPQGEERCAALISDRALKTDFATVDGQALLAQVAALPIQSWRYRTEDRAVRHIGPMAQDFAAAFNVGDDDRYIHVVDAQGVALAAIQALIEQVAELRSQLALIEAPLPSSATNPPPSSTPVIAPEKGIPVS